LLVLGFAIGTIGTLIGAGGGFLLVPLLALSYPRDSPAVLTAISLTAVFLNAFSGSIAYARMRRIDMRSGLWFSLATIPGAILGALTTARLDRRVFDPLLGGALVLAAGVLLLTQGLRPGWTARAGHTERRLIESDGTTHHYSFSLPLGIGLSLIVGYVSSLLGIGGGILHVPILVLLLGFPVHVATATSHFVLAITALTGVLTHVGMGSYRPGLARIVPIGLGVLVGAQVGARLSNFVQGRWILRGLAIALAAVGVRLILHP
jgi:uncharacterized membrane protein YfcA